MTLIKPDGTVMTQTEFNAALTTKAQPSNFEVTSAPIYEDYIYPGTTTKGRRLKYRAGQVITQKDKDDAYIEAVISTLAPTTGALAGGTQVVISGSGFLGTTSVTFGGTAATAVVVNSDSKITCVTPAKTAGAVTVNVVTPAGTATKATAFTYA